MKRLRRVHVPPRRWVRELVVPLGAALSLFPLVSAVEGDSVRGAAIERTRSLVGFEQGLGTHVEPGLTGWLADHPALELVAHAAYFGAHLTLLIVVMAWVYLAHPHAFARLRATFLTAQAATILGYITLPTAPPRMLGGGPQAQTSALAALLQSPYAALPSGHVIFALIVGGTLVALAHTRAVRLLGALYPLGMTCVTLSTGNHLWVDAAGGAAVTLGAAGMTVAAEAARRRVPQTLGARRARRPPVRVATEHPAGPGAPAGLVADPAGSSA